MDNHPGQNVYYVCVFNPETEEFVHQGSAKHLQVNTYCRKDGQKEKKLRKTESPFTITPMLTKECSGFDICLENWLAGPM